MPLFILTLYYFTSSNYSLLHIASIILMKETILLFLRLNLLKKEIKNINYHYLYSIFFILMLYSSFISNFLFYTLEVLLIINIFKNDK